MSLWGRVFAAIYDRSLADAERHGLAERRAALLAGARGRVLELGAGTGLNLAHYGPQVTELVLTEPDPDMARRLRARVAASRTGAAPGGAEGARDTPAARAAPDVVAAPAEALPYPDGSFDTVVCTLVLCTVRDPAAALREAARVLRPGGRLLFLEHVRSEDGSVARLQDRVAPVWRVVGRGCHCNRDTAAALAASPLDVERLDRGRIPRAAKFVKPAIEGVAVLP